MHHFSEPFSQFFDLKSGMSNKGEATKRYLSNMNGMYADQQAYYEVMAQHDPLVYEFYELKLPEYPGELLFGTSIVYPGKVGDEYYMTKGHFHSILETGEVYYCLSGEGFLLLENPEGEWSAQRFTAGSAVYVPPRYAHRSINTGHEPLVTFFVFRADAGHEYGLIEKQGFRKLIVEENGEYSIINNSKWSE